MEEPEFRLYDLVVCTETGDVGVTLELHTSIAIVQFPTGIRRIEYLDIEILARNAPVYPNFYDDRKTLRGSWPDLH